jgi:anthranilate phosphoribosyltransferase
VLLNAAAVLVTAGIAKDVREGVAAAAAAIESGSVKQLVVSLQAQ